MLLLELVWLVFYDILYLMLCYILCYYYYCYYYYQQFNPFELVIPLFIRSFIRETNGEILMKKKPKVAIRKGPQRRLVPHKPVFGTVDSVVFVKGEEGLVGNDAEEEKEAAAALAAEEAPWEEHLSYGAGPAKDAKIKKAAITTTSSKGSNRQ